MEISLNWQMATLAGRANLHHRVRYTGAVGHVIDV